MAYKFVPVCSLRALLIGQLNCHKQRNCISVARLLLFAQRRTLLKEFPPGCAHVNWFSFLAFSFIFSLYFVGLFTFGFAPC